MKSRKGMPLVAAAIILFAPFATNAFAAADFMPVGGATSQPVGHYEFCQREPRECGRTENKGPVKLTRALWAKMLEINNAVNSAVFPETDMERWGVEEYWSYPDVSGDCEDYVLEKRRLLMEAGVPAANLLITVVLQPNGDGHAVLTVETDMGDFILDNMEARILLWSQTGYQYLKRQSTKDASRWVAIRDGRSLASGAFTSSSSR